MAYEAGMQIIFDVVNKGVFVEFRGKTEYLPGPFPNQKAAIAAAEEYCRKQGWEDSAERRK
jgi:hypothetical protein